MFQRMRPLHCGLLRAGNRVHITLHILFTHQIHKYLNTSMHTRLHGLIAREGLLPNPKGVYYIYGTPICMCRCMHAYFVRLIVFMHVYGCCGLIIICSQGSSA
jgi:hypothetical protein